jgi:membrane protease YdiL (CAAX protease family)
MFKGLELELGELPLPVKLLALAAVPAICEEFFFRGFLFRACRTQWSPTASIIVTAAAFGAFHVLVRDALLFERFLPTALMGLALGWVAHRTGSTLPGMLLHVLHNGLLLSLGEWLDPRKHTWLTEERQSLPWWVLAMSGVVVMIAVVVLNSLQKLRGPTPADK